MNDITITIEYNAPGFLNGGFSYTIPNTPENRDILTSENFIIPEISPKDDFKSSWYKDELKKSKYVWVEVVYDPNKSLSDIDLSESLEPITKKIKILETAENLKKLDENPSILEYKILDFFDPKETVSTSLIEKSITTKEQSMLFTNKCEIDFKEITEVINLTRIIFSMFKNKTKDCNNRFWKGGFTEELINDISELYKSNDSMQKPVIDYLLLKDILKSISLGKPGETWVNKITDTIFDYLKLEKDFGEFEEFLSLMYQK